jgi:hypothetical protein
VPPIQYLVEERPEVKGDITSTQNQVILELRFSLFDLIFYVGNSGLTVGGFCFKITDNVMCFFESRQNATRKLSCLITFGW